MAGNGAGRTVTGMPGPAQYNQTEGESVGTHTLLQAGYFEHDGAEQGAKGSHHQCVERVGLRGAQEGVHPLLQCHQARPQGCC